MMMAAVKFVQIVVLNVAHVLVQAQIVQRV